MEQVEQWNTLFFIFYKYLKTNSLLNNCLNPPLFHLPETASEH